MSHHSGKVNSVAYNHNSRVLASSGDDGSIVLSHTETSDRLATLEPTTFQTSPINSIAFTSKSDMIGCGSLDGVVRVWDLRKKEVTASFKHHTDSVSCVTWNYTDQQIVSSSMSGEIMVHSLLTKVSVCNLKLKGSAGIKVVQFSPFKKNFLGAGSENGSVYIWDLNLRSVACSFPSFHNSPVTGLAFSAINHMLMCTSGLDQRINFYDTHEKKIVKTIDVDSPLTCISYATDGHTLAGGTLYGTVLIYDLRNPGAPKNVLKGHEGNAVNWLEFAKSRDVKARVQRDSSREMRDVKDVKDTRDSKDVRDSRDVRDVRDARDARDVRDTRESIIRPEDVSVGASRFRTIEEIKLEAKMRVEQKRRERANDEQKAETRPDTANLTKVSSAWGATPNSTNKEEKQVVMSQEIRSEKASGLRHVSRERTGERVDAGDAGRLDKADRIDRIDRIERIDKIDRIERIDKPDMIERINRRNEAGDDTPTAYENGKKEAEGFRELARENEVEVKGSLVEMIESRLSLQDEAIFDIKEDIQNLHVEVIRQFMIQIVIFNQ